MPIHQFFRTRNAIVHRRSDFTWEIGAEEWKRNSVNQEMLIRNAKSLGQIKLQKRHASYIQRYKDKLAKAPAQHLTSFLILHELTAIIPLPLVYFALEGLDLPWDNLFSPETLEVGDVRMKNMMKYFGFTPFEQGSSKALNAAASYIVVKAAMPLRVGASFALTPWFAKRFISPIVHLFKRK